MSSILVIGGGLAGAKGVEALREQGFDGDIVLFGSEEHLPYERPPLSKEYLAGSKSLPDFTVHDADWYRDNKIDFRAGTTVDSIDRAAKTVRVSDGSSVGYDKLLLATGSAARHLGLPGADATGVAHLRTIDDAEALRDSIDEGTRVAIVGGGWIGLEVAASARGRGAQVTVAEQSALPLARVLGTEVAEVFARLHRDHGVDLRTEVQVAEVLTDAGRATGIRFTDGTEIPADVVLIAAGAVPNLGIAEAAGLDTGGGGVLVSAGLQSSDPDIYVAGDIANAENPTLGRRVRTEHWANALNQPAVAATNMLGGSAEYTNLPYFFTDQYNLGMEYTGLADEYDQVVFRGDVPGLEFVAFWIDSESRLLAGMQVNIWDQLDAIKKLIVAGTPVDAVRLADPDVPLTDLGG